MGNPLGPLFANIFMAELEKNNMERLKQLGVVFWIRYVDDIFVILKSSTNAMEVEKFLNSIHQNIKFTTENEKNRKLPFLDVLVINKHGRLHTEMYRKPTFTGVYLNWFSLTSKKYKVGLIGCLVDRIWKICSDPETRELELKRTRSILLSNNYPASTLDEHMEKFVKKKSYSKQADPNEYAPKATDVPKDICWLKLPYLGKEADEFGTKVESLINSNFNTLQLRVVFMAPSQLSKHFKFKDKIKELEKQSLIVYHIRCSECDADYIGKTERIFQHRINEHSSSHTGNEDSAIRAHHIETGHTIDFKGAKILDRADSDRKLQLKELLHIDKRKPILNKQLNSQAEFRINVNIIGSKKN
jgi:hypothetical protein